MAARRPRPAISTRPTSTIRTTRGPWWRPEPPRIGGFGTYQVAANGQWSYTLDNANAAVQALNGAATLIDTFNVVTADGTTQLVSVTIHAQNDAATVTGDAAGSVTESGVGDSGDLDATDPDNTADAWQAVAAGAATANGFGSYALSASGVWTYTLDNDNAAVQALNGADTLTDTFTALTADGTAQTRDRHDPRAERCRDHHRHRGGRRHRGRRLQQLLARDADRDRRSRTRPTSTIRTMPGPWWRPERPASAASAPIR